MTVSERQPVQDNQTPNGGIFGDSSPDELRSKCFDELEKASDPDDILLLKRGIITLTAYINPDEVEGLFGVGIVAKNENETKGASCVSYALGSDANVQDFYDNLPPTFNLAKQAPVEGAFALYFQFGIFPKHIGKVVGEGKVISKWGTEGHVYIHDPLMVPLQYGETVVYYLPK